MERRGVGDGLIIAIPEVLREKLGPEGARALADLLNEASVRTRGDVIEIAASRFERRLAEELAQLRSESCVPSCVPSSAPTCAPRSEACGTSCARKSVDCGRSCARRSRGCGRIRRGFEWKWPRARAVSCGGCSSSGSASSQPSSALSSSFSALDRETVDADRARRKSANISPRRRRPAGAPASALAGSAAPGEAPSSSAAST